LNPVGGASFILFAFVQWCITRIFIRHAGIRFAGKPRALVQIALGVFAVLVLAGYLCTMSDLTSRWGLPPHPALIIGAICFAHLIAATFALAIYGLMKFARRSLNAATDTGRRRVLNAAGNALMASPFVVIGYGTLVQRTDLRVREIDIPLPRLHPDLDGIGLLQISDIHLSPFLSEAEFARVIDAACELRPHATLITGDLISSCDDPLDACIRQLARLKADAGVFGCMGNHERYAGAEETTQRWAARAGIRFLRGQAQPVRFGGAVLNFAGVDYQSMAGRKSYLRGAERLIDSGACNVLLSHNPDVFPVAAQQGYNLMLAGHTHGGQVTVEILDRSINPARFLTPYVYGLYRLGASAAYVTRGIGTIGLPARIGAPPEICMLRLRKA
jgi:predicted MPP superfamily phosphohydrolase